MMIRKRIIGLTSGLALAMAIVMAGLPVAQAGYAYGNWKNFTVNGSDFACQSYIYTTTGHASAVQRIQRDNGVMYSGWGGNLAVLYKNNAAFLAIGIEYNPSNFVKGGSYYTSAATTAQSGIGWHSEGICYGWSSATSTYTTAYSPKSPSQNS